jgi:manganese/zinc/iron transport system substrate-binding protein
MLMTRSLQKLILLTLVLNCTQPELFAATPRLSIVATTSIIGDTAKAITGDAVEVHALMGPGVDPHLYKPTRADMAIMSKANLLLVNGLLLEGKFEETFERMEKAGKIVVRLGNFLEKSSLRTPPEFNNHHDPHIWMDPTIWSEIARLVYEHMSKALPAQKETFAKNLKVFQDRLKELDNYASQTLAQLPEGRRHLVTAHDAFGYFGRRYDLKIHSIQGISTESEAGVRQIEELVANIVSNKIPAIFIESTVSPRNISALVEGCKAQGFSVVIGGELYSDGMGASGTYEGTYQGMIDHNITVIGRALGASVPEKGLFGKLATPAAKDK